MELVRRVSLSDLRRDLHKKYGKASRLLTLTLILTAALGDVVRIAPNEVDALFRCDAMR